MHRGQVGSHVTFFIIKSRYLHFPHSLVKIVFNPLDGLPYSLRAKPTGKESSMLVLSRKLGERIVIGDRLIVTVVKLDNGQGAWASKPPRKLGSSTRRSLLASPWCNRSSEGYPNRRSRPVRQGSGRGTGGNRGVQSVREGHGTDAVGSRAGHRGRRMNRILSRIVPPAFRYCARTWPRV